MFGKKTIIKVNGMMCKGCEDRVSCALLDKLDIKSVKANHKKGTVTIRSKEVLDLNKVKSIINDLGFNYEE